MRIDLACCAAASRTTRRVRDASCCDCRTTGTGAWWWLGHPGRAASSTAISPGAITSCRRGTRTLRRTRECWTFSFRPAPIRSVAAWTPCSV